MFQTVLNTTIRVAALSAIPELNEFEKRLIGVCYLEFEKIPSLQSFIDGSFSFPSIALHKIEISRSQYLILDGTAKGKILEHVGENVEVVGRINASRHGTTKHGDPYNFLNMGSPCLEVKRLLNKKMSEPESDNYRIR